MKHLLAIVFLLVFSIQVLPVKELGRLLYKGAVAEEIHEVETESNKGDIGKLKWRSAGDLFYCLADDKNHEQYLSSIARIALLHSDRVLRQYFPDTVTQPPNFI